MYWLNLTWDRLKAQYFSSSFHLCLVRCHSFTCQKVIGLSENIVSVFSGVIMCRCVTNLCVGSRCVHITYRFSLGAILASAALDAWWPLQAWGTCWTWWAWRSHDLQAQRSPSSKDAPLSHYQTLCWLKHGIYSTDSNPAHITLYLKAHLSDEL